MTKSVNTYNRAPTLVTRMIPPLFAAIILLTGTIMLFTGALPGLSERMAWLRQNLPLSTIKLSQFLSSLIGGRPLNSLARTPTPAGRRLSFNGWTASLRDLGLPDQGIER